MTFLRPGFLVALAVGLTAGAFACGGNGSSAADAGADSAVAIDATTGVGCDPYEFRSPSVELFIGPDGLENRLIDEIRAAKSQLYVMMYLLTLDQFVDELVAAHQRGVDVRIILDRDHAGNVDSRADLLAAGVDVRDSPAAFTHSHTKAMIIDGERAIIMSSNLNFTSMDDERNYGVIDRDPEDLADLLAVFDSDWTGVGYPDLSCTRLLVSPVNSRARILAHVNRAATNLDMSVMYIADDSTRAAIIQRHNAGVNVRVILADPQWIADNYQTAETLQNVGVQVRFMEALSMHAKLIVADGVPFVGSQNLSFTSFTQNREVGVIVLNSTEQNKAQVQFESDWSIATMP